MPSPLRAPTGSIGLLTAAQPGPTASGVGRATVPRWVPTVGGAVLVLAGLRRRSGAGAALATAGGALAYVGLTGRVAAPGWVQSRLPARGERGLVVERAVTVLRPPEELYGVWRTLENLPRFMPHLQAVTASGDGRSHWVAAGPAGSTVEWDARIVAEQPNELLRWESLPGARVPHRGEVRFSPAPGERGTEVRVRLEYDRPAGLLGATVAQLVGRGADRQVREGLRRFKRIMETGEIPTNDGQPRGRCR
ncbi:MAG: SRPBCC family protein [Sphaerobacter sp.]|nr:SRPBCC family protein [Sphaerobacter sp.]